MAADCNSSRQFGQSRSGSAPLNPKFDGPSSSNEKFELQQSDGGNNPNIGKIGWGK